MLTRLKTALTSGRSRTLSDFDEEAHYVAGKTADNEPITHSVSLLAVEEILQSDHFQWGCTSCGKCCSGPGAVYFTETDLENVRLHLQLEGAAWERAYRRLVQKKSNGLFVHQTSRACVLLSRDLRCSVYPVRPLQCRTYPFWTSSFESEDAHAALKKSCAGARNPRGELFSLRELVARVNRTADTFNRAQKTKTKTLYL